MTSRVNRFIDIIRFFFFKQRTAYELRISHGSSDVCSSDLCLHARRLAASTTTTVAAIQASWAATHRRRRPASPSERVACGHGGARKRVVQGKSVSVRVDLGGRRIIK